MKDILLATDFSDRADRATSRAVALAKSHGATLRLVHVVDDDLSKRVASGQETVAKEQLDEVASAAKSEGVKCVVLVARGQAHEAIADAAVDAGTDLIVIGSHRRDPLRNAFVGTTAERLIRVCSTPVLVVRAETPKDYACAAVAVDLGEEGVSHIDRLQKLGLSGDDCIVPIFAYEAGEFHLMRRAGATVAELKAAFEAEKNTISPTVSALMNSSGLRPDQAVVKPVLFNTPDTILGAADEANADLLVVGSRRKTAFKRFTLGSVSEACLLRAEIDLLVLPPEA